jgi:hypothetical protein
MKKRISDVKSVKDMYGMGGSTKNRAESPYKYGGMTKGEMMLHGGNTKAPGTFNGHRCEKRNMCENMTGYTFDANGVGTRGGKKTAAKPRPKNFIG